MMIVYKPRVLNFSFEIWFETKQRIILEKYNSRLETNINKLNNFADNLFGYDRTNRLLKSSKQYLMAYNG